MLGKSSNRSGEKAAARPFDGPRGRGVYCGAVLDASIATAGSRWPPVVNRLAGKRFE